MSRSIETFPFPPSQRAKLQKAGFLTVQDILEVSPLELSKELHVSKDEALEILQIVRNGSNPVSNSNLSQSSTSTSTASSSSTFTTAGSTASKSSAGSSISALEMLQKETTQGSILTGSSQIDAMIGNGIPIGKITEFCGAPGIGKTQLGIQLAVNSQLPTEVGGLDGEAIYIDTEGSFIIERAEDIAEGGIKLAESFYRQRNGLTPSQPIPQDSVCSKLTILQLLSGIHYYRVHDYIEQIALINILPEFIAKHPKVRLIVFDSIAFHFRYEFDDMSLRTRLLNGMSQSLLKLATDFSLAVVLINQMTTKIGLGSEKSHLVPALGESWGHASTNRVIMFWQNGIRHAMLYKSPSMQESTVMYQVLLDGIRDIAPEPSSSSLAKKRAFQEVDQ